MQPSLTNQDPETLLTESQAGKMLGFSDRTMQAWRVRGGGPRFVKISSRAIRYRRQDLIDWAATRFRTSTSGKAV